MEKTLYTVSNAHLDTQWNWTIEDTIRDCVKNTLERNFALIERFPHYRMNFEGAFRYALAKEYYPELYETLKGYVAAGRWNVAGSSWDACDVNVPSSEGLMRQILLGNGYFEDEFGKRSSDIFLTDCFGFRYALPSIAAHMGLNGFSTQKLVWGVGSPIYEADGSVSRPVPDREKPRMDLGKWVGPDGNFVIASFLEGDYTYQYDKNGETRPVDKRQEYLAAIEHNEKYTGIARRSMYYGVGDYGGAAGPGCVKMVEDAIQSSDGLYKVVAASSDQIFNELTAAEIAALPAYKGGLLIPHGYGALTSHTINKRWNRKCELLADAAERAASLSALLGVKYPAERLETAWKTFLWHQFHDDLPGTSIAAAYVYSYNDFVIALNMFAAELTASIKAASTSLDTNVKGTPVIVYNPLGHARRDTVSIDCADGEAAVFDRDGNELPSQRSADGKTLTFAVTAAPVSIAAFDIRDVSPSVKSALSVTERSLENGRYRVSIDENGDISNIFDKKYGRELLSAPSRFSVTPDNNTNWPSWEIKYDDTLLPADFVDSKPEFTILENGAAKVALKITRKWRSSSFEQVISLCDGGERVDVDCHVEWYERRSLLRAEFPLAVSNEKAKFDLGLGCDEEGSTKDFPYFQRCVHKWADQTDSDGSYGVTIINDCKYGMDKPDDSTLRLTLIHTPLGAFAEESGQDWQDMGTNIFRYSFAGHEGGDPVYTRIAEEANLPLYGFTSDKHDGIALPSLASTDESGIVIRALKKERHGDRLIVRVQETAGAEHHNVKLAFASEIASAVETNGFEDEKCAAVYDGKSLIFALTPWAVKTFAVQLTPICGKKTSGTLPLSLVYNTRVTASNDERENIPDGEICVPSEQFAGFESAGVEYSLGCPCSNNAVSCSGQTLVLPNGAKKLHLLAASLDGDREVKLSVGGVIKTLKISDMFADVGAWDMIVAGTSKLIKRDELARVFTHTHIKPTERYKNGDRYYKFAYMFAYELNVEGADFVVLPNDSNILVFAATVGFGGESVRPTAPLYDVADQKSNASHTVKCDGCFVGVKKATIGSFADGALTLIRASEISSDGKFKGWELDGGEIEIEDGVNLLIRITGDITVKAVYESLGKCVTAGKPCTACGFFAEAEKPENALDGSDADKWCVDASRYGGEAWLEIDLGETVKICRWLTRHAGVWEDNRWNTSDFRLEYKGAEGDEWRVCDSVEHNRENSVLRNFAPVEARYLRLVITKPTAGHDSCVRLYQIQVFGE